MKKISIIIIVIVAVLAIVIGLGVGKYNSLVTEQEKVTSALSDIDTVLQRRLDLIPNLVSTVKGFAKQELEAIDKVTSAREALAGATTVSEKAETNEALSSSLNNLLVIVENYPELKSNENFIHLSDELAGTENRIAVARKDYNDAVKNYNTLIKKFPGSIIAGMFNFDAAEYFEASKGAENVPEVNFD